MYYSAVHSEPVMAVLELLPAARPPDSSPVEDVEEQEENREDDEEGQVCHLKQIVSVCLLLFQKNYVTINPQVRFGGVLESCDPNDLKPHISKYQIQTKERRSI